MIVLHVFTADWCSVWKKCLQVLCHDVTIEGARWGVMAGVATSVKARQHSRWWRHDVIEASTKSCNKQISTVLHVLEQINAVLPLLFYRCLVVHSARYDVTFDEARWRVLAGDCWRHDVMEASTVTSNSVAKLLCVICIPFCLQGPLTPGLLDVTSRSSWRPACKTYSNYFRVTGKWVKSDVTIDEREWRVTGVAVAVRWRRNV